MEHVRVQPGGKRLAVARDRVPVLVELVRSWIVAVGVRRLGAAGGFAYGADHPGRDHAGVGTGLQLVDDLLDRDDRVPGREHGFLLYANDALDQHIAVPVGFLGMHDRHIRPDRRHRREFLAGERAVDELDLVVHLGQVRADIAAQDRQRQPSRARFERIGHGRMAVFEDLDRMRPAFLDRIAQPVQRTHTGVAAPGKDQLLGAAGADHLVVDQIRRHADQGQIAFLLADDFVAGRKRNQMREAFQGRGGPVGHISIHRLGQGQEFSHGCTPAVWFAMRTKICYANNLGQPMWLVNSVLGRFRIEAPRIEAPSSVAMAGGGAQRSRSAASTRNTCAALVPT